MSKSLPDEQQLKSEIMYRLEEEVDSYFSKFNSKCEGGERFPSIEEIEDIVSDLRSKTRDIYLDLISESINSFNEAPIIESKKEST